MTTTKDSVRSAPMSDLTEGYADAGGIQVHYWEAGKGAPLICLHGGGPGATGLGNYRYNVDALASSFRTIIVDLPQFGKSDKPIITSHPLAFYAGVLADFMASLGIGTASLVGNSLGAGVSAKFAIEYPDRVTSLVLMGASGHGPSLFVPDLTEGIRKLRAYYSDPTRERMRDFLETFVADPALITDELLEERYANSVVPEVLALQTTHRLPRTENIVPQLGKIAVPTLLIWGREERFVPLDHALAYLRYIPNATLLVVPNCGHWVQYENPSIFNEYTLQFLGRHGG